jgi:hypothetical protein
MEGAAMALPGFSAELSLYRSRKAHRIRMPRQFADGRAVVPQKIADFEVHKWSISVKSGTLFCDDDLKCTFIHALPPYGPEWD